MNVENQPKLRFHGVDIINVNLHTSKPYDNETSIDLKVEPKVFYPTNNDLFFRIFMEVSIVCDGFFSLRLDALGNFEFDCEFNDPELKKVFVNANAPAIMFPYVRSFVSTLSVNLGNVTGPLIIPTQFFHGELEELDIPE